MHVVLVYVHVKPEHIEAFKEATLENARNSILEPGIVRFDVLQQVEDPSRFVLVEVYRTAEDQGRHRETQYYQVWRDKVAEMMAEPRQRIRYVNLFPEDNAWR